MKPPTKPTRRSQRRKLVLEVHWDSGSRKGIDFITNLSDHGLFLATSEFLDVGDKLLLKIIGPRGLRIDDAEGVVRWRLESTFDIGAGVGVEFTRIDHDMLRRILEINRAIPENA
jgi:hypothetical protein